MKHFYIAACHPEGGIYHFTPDEHHHLQLQNKTAVDRPMYLHIRDRKLYALLLSPAQTSPNSALCSFFMEPDGRLTPDLAPVSTLGEECCYLCHAFGFIYAANYTTGSLVRLSEKGEPPLLIRHYGSGPNLPRQDSAHLHYIHPTPDGRYLAAADLGTDSICTYDRDLRLLAKASVPAGNGCRHLVFSDDGQWAYCADELSSSVSVFSCRDGKFIYRNTVSAFPPELQPPANTSAAIRFCRGLVYLSNRGHDSISVFRAAGEQLDLICTVPSGGRSPRDFDLFDDLLVCTNEGGTVTVFRLENGIPRQEQEISNVPGALCVTAADW